MVKNNIPLLRKWRKTFDFPKVPVEPIDWFRNTFERAILQGRHSCPPSWSMVWKKTRDGEGDT